MLSDRNKILNDEQLNNSITFKSKPIIDHQNLFWNNLDQNILKLILFL